MNPLLLKTVSLPRVLAHLAIPGWHDETSWSNTVQMTPESNEVRVLANIAETAQRIINIDYVTGYTTMDIIVDDEMVSGIGKLNKEPILVKKQFNGYDGDTTVVIEILVADY